MLVAGKASGLGRDAERSSQSAQMQYIANVGLKVNHKLGGKNMQARFAWIGFFWVKNLV